MACKAATGVITLGGSILSNIAVICRNLMKPCIVGLNAQLHVPEGTSDEFTAKLQPSSRLILSTGEVVHAGQSVTVDGSTGILYLGQVQLTTFKKNPNFLIMTKWADKYRRIRVEATIGSSSNFLEDIRYADEMGADGFCVNTDQLLSYTKDRLTLMRLILFSQSEEERQTHLSVLTELQRDDFRCILRATQGKPTCIKLLDKSLHHLMPADPSAAFQIALSMNRSVAEVKRVIENVNNQNPAFGLRGCRIAALYPYLYVMQVQALVMAIFDLAEEVTFMEPVRIAVPMINSEHEFDDMSALIKQTAEEVSSGSISTTI
jgi:pyruvate,orthophosphate dikinase